MKKRFRIWHLPLLSFYSKRLYRDISTRWKGTNLGFLCLLVAVCLLPSTNNTSQKVAALIDDHSETYLMQVPEITISNGQASANVPQPYSIIEGDQTLMLIDTTGKINALHEADARILMTASHIYIDQDPQPPIEYNLASIKTFYMDQEIAAGLVEHFKQILLPAFYVVSLIVSYVLLLLAALVCGLVAQLFGLAQDKKISYGTGLRLAVTAFTPPLIISALVALFGGLAPFWLYPLLALAYLLMAVGACRKKQPGNLYIDDEPVQC
jgi:hypothetical protein